MMYFYLQPRGGFNDILSRIQLSIDYCKKSNRVLLLDTMNSEYKINFSDYFTFDESIGVKIIYDIEEIKEIVKNEKLTTFPTYIRPILNDIACGNVKMRCSRIFDYVDNRNNSFNIPRGRVKEDIIVYIQWGGSRTYDLFSKIIFKPCIIEHCTFLHDKIQKPYVAIQIRNTDYKCNYERLYEDNKKILHQMENVFIATDDKNCLDFFKAKNLNVMNFTTFPNETYYNLHYSKICPETKIKDMFADLYIASMADKFFTNSKGNFVKLIRTMHLHKAWIQKMFTI